MMIDAQLITDLMAQHEKGRPAILILDDIKAILTHVQSEDVRDHLETMPHSIGAVDESWKDV